MTVHTSNRPTLFILNTTILTVPGNTYESEVITVEAAQRIVKYHNGPVVSAVGHQATADIATMLLEHDVPMSRIAAEQRPGDRAICVKLRGRAPEGAILTREQVEAMGYDLVLLDCRDPASRQKTIRDLERMADLLASLDDRADLDAEHTPGTRRRCGDAQEHFIVRHALVHGGGYTEVWQDFGTNEWSIREISGEDARQRYATNQYNVRS